MFIRAGFEKRLTNILEAVECYEHALNADPYSTYSLEIRRAIIERTIVKNGFRGKIALATHGDDALLVAEPRLLQILRSLVKSMLVQSKQPTARQTRRRIKLEQIRRTYVTSRNH